MMRAIEAFDVISKRKSPATDRLATIVRYARSPRSPLAENAAGLLGELANHFAPAREAVRQMSLDSKVHVRISALVALESGAPSELHEHVLRAALQDRSKKVRRLSADKIMSFGLRNLLPDLDAAISTERDPESKAVLERERDLLRTGYHIKPNGHDSVWISCRTAAGGVIGGLVSAEDLKRKGPSDIARSLGVDLPVV